MPRALRPPRRRDRAATRRLHHRRCPPPHPRRPTSPPCAARAAPGRGSAAPTAARRRRALPAACGTPADRGPAPSRTHHRATARGSARSAGQNPRPLQENATTSSWPQPSQCTRAKPCDSTPHRRNAPTSRRQKRGTDRSPASTEPTNVPQAACTARYRTVPSGSRRARPHSFLLTKAMGHEHPPRSQPNSESAHFPPNDGPGATQAGAVPPARGYSPTRPRNAGVAGRSEQEREARSSSVAADDPFSDRPTATRRAARATSRPAPRAAASPRLRPIARRSRRRAAPPRARGSAQRAA